MNSPSVLTINRVHAVEYRMPLKRPYGTARGVTRASTNFIVRLHATAGTMELIGVGESQPRRNLSGDVDTNTAWSFFKLASNSLVGRTITLSSSEEALVAVQAIMSDLTNLANSSRVAANTDKPFRGSLLGIEVALLDTVARALRISIAALLGQVRENVEISVRTLSTQNTKSEFIRKVTGQAKRFPMVRVKGSGSIDEDLDLLRTVHKTNTESNAQKPIWMDLNEGFTKSSAQTFIKRITRDIKRRLLPPIVTLEQPVPHSERASLPELQKVADKLTSKVNDAEVRIMADESLWDIEDLEWLHKRGGCRAINIKTAKAGGLIPSLELARHALQLDPRTRICIGGMVGTSDITTWSLINLAKALPRVDYITAVPPGSPVERISNPLTKLEGETSIHAHSDEPGLGARLSYEKLIPYIKRHAWFPPTERTETSPKPNIFPSEYLQEFGKLQLDNHLLERESLSLGLNTLRTNRLGFVARDSDGNSAAFWWTKSTLSSRTATAVTSDKHSTRLLLERAGIPVPKGQPFDPHDVAHATRYAQELGFPVVLKPLRGTGGRGVVTNIRGPEELEWAFDALKGTRYEKSDVLVEEQIEGTSGRAFVVGNAVLSMIQWPHGTLVGDGYLTVGELLLLKSRLRSKNPHLMNRPIKFGDGTLYQLQKQGLDYDSVPALGREVIFTLNPNPQQGGETRDALESLHPSFIEASVDAVKAIPGLAFSGVDWIIPDLTKPLSKQRAAICELNAHPSQSGNEFPLYGTPGKVSRAIVRLASEKNGVRVHSKPLEYLSLEVTVRGYNLGNEYADWLAARARRTGISGSVSPWGRRLVRAFLHGESERVAALVSLAITGPGRSTVEAVESHHTTRAVLKKEFEVMVR